MRRSLDTRFVIKAVAFALLIFTPFQLLLVHFGEEPWPALALPSFKGVSEVPSHFTLKEIHAYTDDGKRFAVEWRDLFPELPGIGPSFKKLNFSPRREPPDPGGVRGRIADKVGALYPISNYWEFRLGVPHGNDPEVRDWLDQRLIEMFPGVTFDSLEFVWYEYDGYIRSSEIPAGAVAESYVVELR